jgi:S-adenosylmethionine:diacylglycerol 3-amino-3-carboxypropyl transferase
VASTPWQRGRLDARRGRPKLLFGQMYEDAAVELAVFPPSGRIFTIASAGTTGMALSGRGLDVIAVDINPAQIEYVRRRLAGAPVRQGTADHLFGFGRKLLPFLGWSRSVLTTFLELEDPVRQMDFWHRYLDTVRFRLGLKMLLNPVSLRAVYDRTFLRVVPPAFDRVMRRRLERCFANHPNRTNPYAWRLFAGIDPPHEPPLIAVPAHIELIQADAAGYLESCPPRSFAGFTLSNILDGTDSAYRDRLMAAVRRSAQEEAVMVLRSFAEPAPGQSTEWAARDRSMLWGVVQVGSVSLLRRAGGGSGGGLSV